MHGRLPHQARGTFLEHLATILLPNSVARGRISRDEVIPLCRIVPIIQYFVIQAGTEQYGGKRISSAVLSTTQPPLRGRRRRKHPVGRRLCIQRETVKQERSVVRGGSSWRSIAGTRRKTLATNLGLSRGRVLAEPA